jgi:hypothetical protein
MWWRSKEHDGAWTWNDDHGRDAHEMMIMVIKHEEMDMEQSAQGKGIM